MSWPIIDPYFNLPALRYPDAIEIHADTDPVN